MKAPPVSSLESRVRSYCRNFPEIFETAQGCILEAASGKRYLDFLSGCGSLNYGHNAPILKEKLLAYLDRDGVSMSLDLETASKNRFMDLFSNYILKPRQLNYRMQFTGPTGANAVEAAIKLARKVTGRTNVIAFSNAFHGCSLGALSLTGSSHHRNSSRSLLNQVTRFPYCGYFGENADTSEYLEKMLNDKSSGVDKPAAIIVEVLQGEGGLNEASGAWLQNLRRISDETDTLLIFDEIQAGCGRCETFFSFDQFGVKPDMVLLAKSLSGYGQPMSMVLIRPEFDHWTPGEHNGTFRGNNLGFVTAAAALEAYWADDGLELEVRRKGALIRETLNRLCDNYDLTRKGRGFMQGIEVADEATSKRIRDACFSEGLIVEACGPDDTVVKLMPPLTIDDDYLEFGLEILERSLAATMRPSRPAAQNKNVRDLLEIVA